ncbi:hypothetical protein NVP2275O_069 [Vibrio phage 2.275.O._10N.286.54.E11]|nr:hypothetical protein NVP2275O_069 [Vibrio phage 2.275.O._10N.286.54.E11]
MDIDNLESIQNLYDNSGLLDVMLAFEEYLDGMDLYVFDNWINGEVVEGPKMSKYWVDVTLKYNADKAPDPRGALLFKNTGTDIQIRKDVEDVPIRIPLDPDDMQQVNNIQKPKIEEVPVILVKFTVPRKLIDPSSSDEYKIIDAENMTNILIDRDEAEAAAPPPTDQFDGDDMDSLEGEF